jgi:hypothetical protein
MKVKNQKYFIETVNLLVEIHKLYPTYRLGQHLSTALDEYGDLWGLTDKELHFALLKYKAQMEMDVPHETNEEFINKIIADGLKLTTIASLQDEDED